MSFVTAIKDYIDLLNNVYDSVSGDITLQQLIQETFFYIFSSIKFVTVYIISFQWLRDLAYLPILIPQISTQIFNETYFLDTPLSTFFTLLETPTYENNKFIIGFLNSFFLCLPLSTTHFISIRRLLIQGVPAGIISSIGTILGYTCFLFSILFGLRLPVIPWLSYEPLSYILGLFLTLTVVYDMAHEHTIRKFDWSQKSQLIQIFFINFILIWTEQSCIFTYFGNLTLNAQPTILDNFSSITGSGSILAHSSYLIGILLGSFCFSSVFIIISLQISNLYLKLSGLSYSRWLKKINFSLLTLIIAFTFTSIPFYSLEYVFGGSLGFISQDKAFDKTLFSSKNVKDSPGVLGGYSRLQSLGTDVTPFDRGNYLLPDTNESFEDLNYQGEYAWTARQDRQALYRTEKSRKLISGFFKKTNQNLGQQDSQIDTLAPSSDDSTSAVKTTRSPFLGHLENITHDTRPSDYFFKLNDRVNNDFKIEQPLEPLLDTSFSQQFFQDTSNTVDPELEKTIKQRYYSNPIYKLLLNADIDLFLRRQPSSYLLSPKEEENLFQKRLILSNYYDSLRYYQKLPYTKDFQTFFNGSKSYADRVYNQQFKGTLNVVRRLFSITFNEENDLSKKIVLKFDQPLYKNEKHSNSVIGHEELTLNTKLNKPFIELTNPIPFYTGWDEQLRKFVITNRLLPRSTAGYNMPFERDEQIKDYPTLTKLFKNTKKIDFTMWPLPRTVLDKSKGTLPLTYTVLYEKVSDPQNKLIAESLDELEDSAWQFNTVPPNFKKIDPDQLNDVVPPNRGGFIWPGHHYLKINLKNILKK